MFQLSLGRLAQRLFALIGQLFYLLFGGYFLLLCHTSLLLCGHPERHGGSRFGFQCSTPLQLPLQLEFLFQTLQFLLCKPGLQLLALYRGQVRRIGQLLTHPHGGDGLFLAARPLLFGFDSTLLDSFKFPRQIQAVLLYRNFYLFGFTGLQLGCNTRLNSRNRC